MDTNKLFANISQALNGVHGWCSQEKAHKLAEYTLGQVRLPGGQIKVYKPVLLAVELGTFGGSSLLPLIMAMNSKGAGNVCGIDPWSTEAALEHMLEEDHRKWWSELDIEAIYQGCKKLVAKYDKISCCTLIRDKAENVVNGWEDNTIDLLHIDGNHSEELSYKDATLYFPKVKAGGIIFFDDVYWIEHKTVTTRKALEFLLQGCQKVDSVGECVILQKT